MKVLVVGAGGREHALCWAIARSPRCEQVICAPGNAGTALVAEIAPVAIDDIPGLVGLAKTRAVDLVVIGPEQPLADGLADALAYVGVRVFGPLKNAAEIEASKSFMKAVCADAGVPTATYARYAANDVGDAIAHARSHFAEAPNEPLVVKADGLAAGKGVVVAATEAEALAAVNDALTAARFGDAGRTVLLEQFLNGEELSFFAVSDGKTAVPLGWAQDHKRAFDGDEGPNTGGMGAYSPPPMVDSALDEEVMR
ncbi:MAG: phosphoribosylamine--glycine ligase, partial [Pseudomonadota bacterium]